MCSFGMEMCSILCEWRNELIIIWYKLSKNHVSHYFLPLDQNGCGGGRGHACSIMNLWLSSIQQKLRTDLPSIIFRAIEGKKDSEGWWNSVPTSECYLAGRLWWHRTGNKRNTSKFHGRVHNGSFHICYSVNLCCFNISAHSL